MSVSLSAASGADKPSNLVIKSKDKIILCLKCGFFAL